MEKKEKILVVVDMQKDFVDGALGTPEAQAIVPKVEEKIKGDYDEVYFTFDTHDNNYLDTLEGKKLPVEHCIIGTPGWSLAIKTDKINVNNIIEKNTFGGEYVYGGIHCGDDMIESIEVIGLCTDICVISNALILRSRYPNVPMFCDASCCAGTTPEAHKAALAVMKSCQIDVINE